MKEQYIQKKIIKALEERGCWVCKVITANKRGVPDILACCEGKFLAVEVKAKGKLATVSPLQEHQLNAIRDAGGAAILTDSVDFTLFE